MARSVMVRETCMVSKFGHVVETSYRRGKISVPSLCSLKTGLNCVSLLVGLGDFSRWSEKYKLWISEVEKNEDPN